jgi:mono/diheme cytochrome c family protein
MRMTKLTIAMTGLVVLAMGVAGASQEKPQIVTTRPPVTDVSDGPGMFKAYCASCHGINGKGNGPAAKALKTAPADLTKISERNDGKFPDAKVRRYIEGLDEVAAHGSRDMPVWCDVLRGIDDRDQTTLRISALTAHIRSLQEK